MISENAIRPRLAPLIGLKKVVGVLAVGALAISGVGLASALITAAPASAETQKPDSSGFEQNTFYAFVRAGESLRVESSAATVVTAPDGVQSGPGEFDAVATDGVWIVDIDPPVGQPMSYQWEVAVDSAAGETILGRVWSSVYTMLNPANVLPDYKWWILNDSGYRYQVTTNGYNGIQSRIRATAVGYTEPGTCTPLYRSVESATVDWNPVEDCAGEYRVFFEEPDAALPVSAPSAQGELLVAPAPLLEEDLESTDISFTPAGDGSAAGVLSYAVDSRFSGGYTIQIDANGNGVYDDPEDRTESFGTDGSARYTYEFDGLDGNGAEIAACTAVTARIAFDRIGEVHVLQDDVEGRTGGIEIIRQTGPGAPDATIYWNDTALVNPTSNTTPVLDGTAGVDSTGGVHGWEFAADSWGGRDRGIDDWTYYATDATSREVSLNAASIECLSIEKSSDFTSASRVGDTVTYTVTATNTGGVDFTAENPAVVFDDLSGVLDDASYNGDATADLDGEISYQEPLLAWSGPLAAGASVELSYTVDLIAGGDRTVKNVAWAPADPENPQAPACDPRDADGRDPVTGEPCAVAEDVLPQLSIEKSADKAEVAKVGETVTYTIVATNDGPGAYTVESPATVVDDLADVLDDARFVEGSLSASSVVAPVLSGDRITWAGPLAAGESVELSYQVTYTGAGDLLLANIAWAPTDPTEPNPPACDPRDESGRDPVTGEACATVDILGPLLTVEKSVDPESGATVRAGQRLTYTLTFSNAGRAAAAVDWSDELSGVLDDAEFVGGPRATEGLSVVGPLNGRLAVTGVLEPGKTGTVTYAVRVNDVESGGDQRLVNFLVPAGQEPPAECVETSSLCTQNPIEAPAAGGFLPLTGGSVAWVALVSAGVVLLLGGGLLLAMRRRRSAA